MTLEKPIDYGKIQVHRREKIITEQIGTDHAMYHEEFNSSKKTQMMSKDFGSVAAHLRGMRPTRSRKKDTLMLREKLKL